MLDETGAMVQEASRGDREAMDALLERFLPELRSFLRMRVGPRILARETPDDLVQSVCREVLQDLPKFEYRGEHGFKRWLYLAADRKIKDRARFYTSQRRAVDRETRVREQSEIASLLSPSRVAIAREDAERLVRAFDSLSAEQRHIVSAVRVLGMTPAELARAMDKSESAIRMSLHRAIARLARVLVEG